MVLKPSRVAADLHFGFGPFLLRRQRAQSALPRLRDIAKLAQNNRITISHLCIFWYMFKRLIFNILFI